MNKFRKWFFQFVFGCELVEYLEILKDWGNTIRLAREICDLNHEINDRSNRILDLAQTVNNRCARLIERCEELESK